MKIVEGVYPYVYKSISNSFFNQKTKPIKILINVKNFKNNYIVLIKGIKYNTKFYIIHKISVVNKNYLKPILEFVDIVEDPSNLSSFTRIIKNQLIVYKNNEPVYNQNRVKASYFTKLKKCEGLFRNFITMDLETKNINGILEPYCICIYDGARSYSFYISKFSSSEEMVKNALKFLMKRKYNRHIVYLHNFSYFDGIFIFKVLVNLVPSKSIQPLIRDGRIINLKVEFEIDNKNLKHNPSNKNKSKYHINFRYSYLLLTASLSKLGKTFSSDKIKKRRKVIFPFSLC